MNEQMPRIIADLYLRIATLGREFKSLADIHDGRVNTAVNYLAVLTQEERLKNEDQSRSWVDSDSEGHL